VIVRLWRGEVKFPHFWLPRSADATRTLKTFENGRNRIVAVAQRKLLARPDERLSLTANDFLAR
jgi:hypothetical protein